MDLEKRLRNKECIDIDRISGLGDDILCKILSYLPLKDVVATSILSTRWKPLFPSSVALVRLDFDVKYKLRLLNEGLYPFPEFKTFVDKLLNVTLRDVLCVEAIVFNFQDHREDIFASWVSSFLRLNVRHLQVMSNRSNHTRALSGSLHGCSTLVELDLGNFLCLRLSEEFVLPHLKRLSLCKIVLDVEMGSFDKLLHGCPRLNDLRITKCNLVNAVILLIRHPNIIKLFVDGIGSWVGVARIVIDAPNLEAIVLRKVANHVLLNTELLHTACIDFNNGEHGSLTKLVQPLSRATRLCLAGDSLADWLTCFDSSSVPVPTFQNLTCLALSWMGRTGSRMLAQFLKSTPNVTLLTLGEGLDLEDVYEGFKSLLPSLPICLELNIKKIEIREMAWIPDGIELIEYFLKKGKVLQELIVHCLPCDNQSNLEKLSMLPKYSEACQELYLTRPYMDFKSLLTVSLLLNIKKNQICEFKISDEIKLTKYLLKKGIVLKGFVVHCLPYENKSGLEKLSVLPRYSEACQVLFTDN